MPHTTQEKQIQENLKIKGKASKAKPLADTRHEVVVRVAAPDDDAVAQVDAVVAARAPRRQRLGVARRPSQPTLADVTRRQAGRSNSNTDTDDSDRTALDVEGDVSPEIS